MLCISQVMAGTLCQIFVGYNPELMAMTLHGFRLFALNYVMSGINVYSSAFFHSAVQRKDFGSAFFHAGLSAERRYGSAPAADSGNRWHMWVGVVLGKV